MSRTELGNGSPKRFVAAPLVDSAPPRVLAVEQRAVKARPISAGCKPFHRRGLAGRICDTNPPGPDAWGGDLVAPVTPRRKRPEVADVYYGNVRAEPIAARAVLPPCGGGMHVRAADGLHVMPIHPQAVRGVSIEGPPPGDSGSRCVAAVTPGQPPRSPCRLRRCSHWERRRGIAMARASAGIRLAVLCTVVSASWLVAGPAQADIGNPVGGAVGGSGGDLARDTVGQVRETVSRVRDTVGQVRDTVGQVTDSSDAPRDAVREVAKPAEPASREAASDAHDGATGVSPGAAEPQRDIPQAGASKPQNHRTAPAADAPSDATADASSTVAPQRRKANGSQPAREPTSAVREISRTSAHGNSTHRPVAAELAAPQVDAAPAPHVKPPCAGGSLAVQDLLRCARAGAPIPGLGGFEMILLPAGLVLVGMGLVLVAGGRRHGIPSVQPAD